MRAIQLEKVVSKVSLILAEVINDTTLDTKGIQTGSNSLVRTAMEDSIVLNIL
jgi:hypothetical protein